MPVPAATVKYAIAPFQKHLIGQWTNTPLPGGSDGEGGPDNPLAYNVMPLPQATPLGAQDTGYILKNSSIFETVRFSGRDDIGVPTTAPNRGSESLQAPTALYYAQQVSFGDGPGKGQIVHTENGTWLHIESGAKLLSPYQNVVLDNPNKQPADQTIAKQMSVPHGNSILALGSFENVATGAPTIPDGDSIFPTPTEHGQAELDTTPYTTKLVADGAYENPDPAYAQNVSAPLQRAIEVLEPNAYLHWSVTTAALDDGSHGNTMNIPFEGSMADVTGYKADYWLLSKNAGESFEFLAYTQNIMLRLTLGEMGKYDFPHITSNVVTKI